MFTPMRRSISFLALIACLVAAAAHAQTNTNVITREIVTDAEKVMGLEFSDEKNDMLRSSLRDQLKNFQTIRQFPLSNSIPSAMLFNPIPVGFKFETTRRKFKPSPLPKVQLPANLDDISFYSIEQLAALIKSRQITSEKLTRFYLDRLKKYGPKLECVITLTEDRGIEQARCADREIAAGHYRGLLHGIPYGVKDLLAAKGAPTTWGSAPYTNQVFDEDGTVVKRLDVAGAVLVAKLTLGELAMGDTWYGGLTRNPWNIKQGSSGSSAGPAAATSAGLLPFAIGSETHGSIVSPCERCGVTGLRPTYGRVSRTGAMALSWSMDKLGPIARSVEDCAIIFNAIYGPDGVDQTLYDVPFNYDARLKWQKLRIGYLASDFEKERGERRTNSMAALDKLRSLGAKLVPIELPNLPDGAIEFVLEVEAASEFDDLTRSGRDDLMKRQTRGSWPTIFRAARFVPAVEYIQANRIRYVLIQETARVLKDIDVFVSPPFTGECHLITNLTGHPCVVVPDGFTKDGSPTAICFLGNLFKEAETLSVAKAYQDATGFHLKHPRLD
jgi:Asp-tRNA(Asn)/Glu-tRNA(Gln) amidotransferase A subunit family amidase